MPRYRIIIDVEFSNNINEEYIMDIITDEVSQAIESINEDTISVEWIDYKKRK